MFKALQIGLASLILANPISFTPPEIIADVQIVDEPIPTPVIVPQTIYDILKQELDSQGITDENDRQRLKDIALCESGTRQFNDDGSLYRGEITPDDVGVMQINELAHPYNMALNMGYDTHTTKGNIDFGIELYKEHKSTPWNPSRACWSRSPAHW